MRMLPPVEENQMPRMRPDHRAVPLYRVDVRRAGIVTENKLTPRSAG